MRTILLLLAVGFGEAKARAEVYFEHAGGGKGASRYPSLSKSGTINGGGNYGFASQKSMH